ncbi:hemolysin family protein [Flaviaesturariibacter amylovorans]|uniref:Hemolysin family protein n=1 Tax=Flaviaesturariibacter amylovorans TaxID=1084520 RepID=A0ABP8GHI5_9BACT
MEIFILLGLILLNGLFVMSEIALVSARKPRLEAAADKGDARARRALELSQNPEIFLSAAQIGITLIAILTGLYSGESFGSYLEPFYRGISFLARYAEGLSKATVVVIVTFLSIVFGELIPKRIGLQRAETISKLMAGPMGVFARFTHPIVWLLNKTSSLFFKVFKIRAATDDAVTEEEIKAIITEGTEAGTIEEEEREMIERIFHLGDRNITSLMTHRSDIAWFDVNDTEVAIRDRISAEPHSIFPVCEGDIDSIKGIVSIKDLYVSSDLTKFKDLMKPALFVPNNNSAYQVMEKLRATKNYAAFIVDEYGSVLGMITLSDIMEAIIGDMPDVEDEEDYSIVPREDGSYLVDAQINFYDFLSHFDKTQLLNDDYSFDTLAGCILHELEHIPHTGETLDWEGFHIEIIDMDGHRIDKVLVTTETAAEEEE